MNIVFMGSGEFGEASLRMLVNKGHRILCVVTQPDKKQDRGMSIGSTPIKRAAVELGLTVYQPVDINMPESVAYLKGLKPDFIVVIAYGQKLSQKILDIPLILPLNIHASLLPAYRGAAPINWAIINGEKVTGVTLMKVTLRMDTGPVIHQKPAEILGSDTAVTLGRRLSVDASEVLIEGISGLVKGAYAFVPQDESKASVAPKLIRANGLIDWNKPAQALVNLVRGCAPWPGAYTHYKGKLIKIHKVSPVSCAVAGALPAGRIARISKEGIVVTASDGFLLIESLQMEGKRMISAGEFIAGYKVREQDTLG
ncbi:MAG: methionyl-tRNA formyltransferase [Candidatus Omnitrophota bacterium]